MLFAGLCGHALPRVMIVTCYAMALYLPAIVIGWLAVVVGVLADRYQLFRYMRRWPLMSATYWEALSIGLLIVVPFVALTIGFLRHARALRETRLASA